MREIKFRFWDGVNYMSNPQTLFNIQDGRIEFTKEAIIMQYSGVKDKYNKEIYEGDILVNHTTVLPCEFRAGCFGTWDGYTFTSYSTAWEIIGNIYETPELYNAPHNLTIR